MQETIKTEVLVIGGGIVGLASAYYLAMAGHQVQVIEKDSVGAGASHGNCGLLFFSDLPPLCQPGAVTHELGRILQSSSPLYIKFDFNLPKWLWLLRFALKCNSAHLQYALAAREKLLYTSRQLFQELVYKEQLACDWQRRGVLMVYKSQAAMDNYEKVNKLLAPYGLGARPLGKSQLRRMEPALADEVCGAWHHDHDSHARPENLDGVLRKIGVNVAENCEALRFSAQGKEIHAVHTTNGTYEARAVLLATGAWTTPIARQLALRIPIQPAKGYSITLARPDICPRIACYFHEPNVVATPWQDGLRLGGTLEFSGFNFRLDKARLDRLKAAAGEYLRPSPPPPIIEEWVGLRPMTYDDLPVIGQAPGWSNLYLACGHGMLGLTMATGTGHAVASLISGQDPGIDMAPYSPARFN